MLTGPGYSNFIETYPPMIAAGGATEIGDARELAQAVDLWLTQPEQLQNARNAARRYVDEQSGQLDVVVDRLISSLGVNAPERTP